MTEAEWLACADPKEMLQALLRARPRAVLEYPKDDVTRRVILSLLEAEEPLRPLLRSRGIVRKLRLLGCAAARGLLPMADAEKDRSLRMAIEVAERCADRGATKQDLLRVRQGPAGWWTVADPQAFHAARALSDTAFDSRKADMADLMRCVFGNPFRPITFNPAWLTPPIPALAQAAYEKQQLPSGELDRGRLAILADALEETGCCDEQVLGHCRGPGPHVRGCWVVDATLCKAPTC